MKVGVIGAGLGGLCSAIKLADEGHMVTVFDGARECGGVLRSVQHGRYSFDSGTHFIVSSTKPDVNRLFIDPYLSTHDTVLFSGPLLEGHFFAGTFQPNTGCPDLTIFPDQLLSQIQAEYLERRCPSSSFISAEDRVLKNYGPTVLGYFFRPTLKKLTGRFPADLSPQIIDELHLNRVVLFGREESRLLKEDPYHDERIAFADLADRQTSITKYYPCQGYFGHYVDFLFKQAKAAGAEFRLGQAVTEVEVSPAQGCLIGLADGSRHQQDSIVWTISPFLALKAFGVPGGIEPPELRTIVLTHFVCSERTELPSMWVTNYDDDFLSYRVTLYENFRQPQADIGGFPITVESVVGSREALGDEIGLMSELAAMSVCKSPRLLNSVGRHLLKVPISKSQVASAEHVDNRDQVLDALSERFVRVGAGRGVSGQVAIMDDVYERLDHGFFNNLL